MIKKFNGPVDHPEQEYTQDNKAQQHHIETIKVNTVNTTYETISILSTAWFRFWNVFLEIVIVYYLFCILNAKRDSISLIILINN
ncbi:MULTISPECIES: hypothetical protein [Chryseobacterium]|uniref:Uncharacterized protein n=1 Tax=Chryseobacterium camelliae TaxID=1265445 RepID=A0ABU0TLV1_9FLAO|nr:MULTISPECIES: hypothetical protein [Chryseobacterium]MDT3408942.1 hypothetical protein [Pseudacidovorax intermedius]MDQ1097203.1 hypothetical protein [Chryseobacterium camelliae]MDQ1101138.1 hypothetical protein [Chryseobacterium sp. SORGH_AS_1048]MDR6084583.1 hypothetical protein [Chryseobacterium sp. SORGH_AS_0909]MDR6132853.1 hypothetical protein [Chryseobacterium sp. SORGH_AS_1175]